MEKTRLPRSGRPIEIPLRVGERAFARFVALPSGCFQSKYSTSGNGYAQIGWEDSGEPRHMVTAHRAAWTVVYGQIPLGLTIDHECRNIRCVNVGHLRLMTNADNARDNRQVHQNGDSLVQAFRAERHRAQIRASRVAY